MALTTKPWLNAPHDLAVRPVWCHVVIDDGLGAAFAQKVARWVDDDGAQYALDGRRVEPGPILGERR